MRPLPAAALLAALGLAACQTPREACLSGASRQLRIVESLIRETQGNLERGYGIEEEQVVRTRPGFCRVREEDGDLDYVRCDRTDVRDVSRPVAVDLAAERAKLEGLIERRDRLLSETSARQQACLASYPQ